MRGVYEREFSFESDGTTTNVKLTRRVVIEQPEPEQVQPVLAPRVVPVTQCNAPHYIATQWVVVPGRRSIRKQKKLRALVNRLNALNAIAGACSSR